MAGGAAAVPQSPGQGQGKSKHDGDLGKQDRELLAKARANGQRTVTLLVVSAPGQSADGDSEESVTVNNPAAGIWIALVDGFAVPWGTTTYNYVDVFANPAFGSVSLTDANALRPAGST